MHSLFERNIFETEMLAVKLLYKLTFENTVYYLGNIFITICLPLPFSILSLNGDGP